MENVLNKVSNNGKIKDPFVELANKDLQSPWNIDRLEFLPQLRGRKGAEVYKEMSQNDSLIGAILFQIVMLLRRVNWEVEATGSGPDGEVLDSDIERADFLSSCMDDMSMPWEEVIKNTLSMLPFGFAYMETVYKRRLDVDIDADATKRTKFPDGKIGWRKFVLVPHETIDEFLVDDFGGVQSAIQSSNYGGTRVDIPIQKALLFRTDSGSPRGISVLRNVVESWFYRKRIREIEGIGIDRDLAGLPVITLDVDIYQNAGKLEEYKRIIRNLRRDEQEGLIFPGVVTDAGKLEPIAKLELLSTGGTRQFDTNTIVNRYSREIAMAVLQDVVLLGHEKVGTQALASEKRDLSDTALQAWLNDSASVFNTYAVPRLFALNGESLQFLPILKPGELRPSDIAEFATALKDIAGAGITLGDDPEVEAEVRRRLGLPQMPPEIQQRKTDDFLEEPDDPSVIVPPPAEDVGDKTPEGLPSSEIPQA